MFLVVALLIASAMQSCAGSQPRYAQPERAADEPLLRIRIAREQTEGDFSAVSKLEVSSLRGSRRAVMHAPVHVRLTDAGWVISSGSAAVRAGSPATPAAASAPGETQTFDRTDALMLQATGAAAITYRGASYPGHVTLHTREDLSPGAFDVVEHVPMEMYLPGVVAKEMYPRWSPAAYEAQAIAARSYAMHERDRRRAKGENSDLDSTDTDQVYGGLSGNSAATDAVRKTRGRILTNNGAVLRAYYSSTCGGRAASARDIWPTGKGFEFNLAAPIQAHERDFACQFSTLYRWTTTRDAGDVARRMAAWGADNKAGVKAIKSIASIEPGRKNEVGRPNEYRVTDAAGKSWTISAEQCRNAINFSDAKGLTPVTKETRVHSGDFEAFVQGKGAGAKITFSGRGFGHGVGMCQHCAEGFARRGESADTMLLRFYPGAKIVNAY